MKMGQWLIHLHAKVKKILMGDLEKMMGTMNLNKLTPDLNSLCVGLSQQ